MSARPLASRSCSGPRGRRRARRGPASVALVVAASVALGVPSAAQDPAPVPAPPVVIPVPGQPYEPPPVGELPEVAPELAAVGVTSDTYDAVEARRDRISGDLAAARQLFADKGAEILVLTAREDELTARITDAVARAEYWEAKADRLAGEMRELAISAYVAGASGGLDPTLSLDTDAQEAFATADVVVGSMAQRQLSELRQAQRNGNHNRNIERISTALREGVRAELVTAAQVRAQAQTDEARLAVELVEAQLELQEEGRLAIVDGAEFPLVVLDAYFKAAQLMAEEAPQCGVPWWALAGIGKIESRHGTYGGAEVRADGSLTRPIIGIPLTGANNTAAIGDSDGGAIDGDPGVDRAAGPMQFIPQTWTRWGRDGDADGIIDAQNIYDAAAAAAAYLCASGPMSDDAGLQRGYFSYNRSLEYVSKVLDAAKGYAESVEIPPVG